MAVSSFIYFNNGAKNVDDVSKIMVENNKLSDAILSNNQELVLELINSKSVDLNKMDEEKKYPLEVALVMENSEMVEFLLSKGADVNQKNSANKSIYDEILETNNSYLINLVKQGK